ncbi:proton channel OtopLc-like [Haliotis rubra]|uniref:proton channel OtopLc-like n=1 Tax=Haliotis rubra TaxID=36100 RepID=UPI001EE59C5D|nr:proton channel OtopLc-like [Haliotis rubra]
MTFESEGPNPNACDQIRSLDAVEGVDDCPTLRDIDVEETTTTSVSSKAESDVESTKRTEHLSPTDGDYNFLHITGNTGKKGVSPELRKNVFRLLSGLYGIFLVMLGAVLPIAETFVDYRRPYFFEAFYVYLYCISMGFLLYVYLYLLRRRRRGIRNLLQNFSRNLRFNVDDHSRSRKVAFDDNTASRHTGSFYLRLGAVGFGIGSMIHSGLTIGHYFEITHYHDSCSDVIQAIKPVAKLTFTFTQLYFLFINSKMSIYRYKVLAQFGLMHMCGTNICVWLRSIVVETLHVTQKWEMRQALDQLQKQAGPTARNIQQTDSSTMGPAGRSGSFLPELSCHWDAMMGKVVEQAAYYLYPCTIEYSLISAGILYLMWKNVGSDTTQRPQEAEEDHKTYRMSVDCAGSSKGLFCGLLVFVFAVICLVAFYVLLEEDHLGSVASLVGHLSETSIYVAATAALGIGSYRMRGMYFDRREKTGLEQTLLLISLSGLMLYSTFSIFSATFYYGDLEGCLTIVTNSVMVFQASTQALFIIVGLRMTVANGHQVRTKPGRECVTFLLISNFAMFGMNVFETQKMEHNPLQVALYGPKAWSIFTHVTVPLGIFYRFHSTVCLSNIWKQAWKRKLSN